MALIKCPDCQHEVSDRAKACPHCAYPIPQTLFNTAATSRSVTSTHRGPIVTKHQACMRFYNPIDDTTVEIVHPMLWTLVFGPFYWIKHEAWMPTFIGVFAAFLSIGLAWLILPIFSQMALRYGYRARGWEEA